VYRRDPVPGHKHRRLNLLNDTLVHVHGEIYIDDEQLKPGKQPYQFQGDPKDHSMMRYAEVIKPYHLAALCCGCNMQAYCLTHMYDSSLPRIIVALSTKHASR